MPKNLVVLAGNAVRDGELYKGIVKLTIAVNEKGIKKDGTEFDKTNYLPITSFGF